MGEFNGSGWDGCDGNGQIESKVRDWNQWDGALRFRAPFHDKTNQVVLLTFERMMVNPWLPSGQTQDMTQVKLVWGEATTGLAPVAVSYNSVENNYDVSYVVAVDGGKEYPLNAATFDWPTNTFTGVDGCGNPTTQTAHHLSFTGFHNSDDIQFVNIAGKELKEKNLKWYFNKDGRDVVLRVKVADEFKGKQVDWSFEDPKLTDTWDMKGASPVKIDANEDKPGDNHKKGAGDAGFVVGSSLQTSKSSTADQTTGIASVTFRVSDYGGDNYKIKAKVHNVDKAEDTLKITV